jgi:polyhydroxyalkanoate synthesis regulator phasin
MIDDWCGRRIGWQRIHSYSEAKMAKSRLTKVAEGIGGAIGRADRTAHKVAKAGVVAKKELDELSKEVEALKKRLQKTARRLQHALR